MNIVINNQNISLQTVLSLEEVLKLHYTQPLQGVAVAINGNVIPKKNWNTTTVQENDSILIITATAGG